MRVTISILLFSVYVTIFAGCYTILTRPEASSSTINNSTSSSVEMQSETSIVEGTVEYHGSGNTAETHYHPGFILYHYSWVSNPPQYSAAVMYLKGAIDSSFLHKSVRIEGTYQFPSRAPRDSGAAPDYTSDMYMYIKNLKVIN